MPVREPKRERPDRALERETDVSEEGTVKELPLLVGELLDLEVEKFLPVGIAGEELSIPPDCSRFEGDPLRVT